MRRYFFCHICFCCKTSKYLYEGIKKNNSQNYILYQLKLVINRQNFIIKIIEWNFFYFSKVKTKSIFSQPIIEALSHHENVQIIFSRMKWNEKKRPNLFWFELINDLFEREKKSNVKRNYIRPSEIGRRQTVVMLFLFSFFFISQIFTTQYIFTQK